MIECLISSMPSTATSASALPANLQLQLMRTKVCLPTTGTWSAAQQNPRPGFGGDNHNQSNNSHSHNSHNHGHNHRHRHCRHHQNQNRILLSVGSDLNQPDIKLALANIDVLLASASCSAKARAVPTITVTAVPSVLVTWVIVSIACASIQCTIVPNPQIVLTKDLYGARCCSDVQIPDFVYAGGTCDLWSYAKTPDGDCMTNIMYNLAFQTCAAYGMGLYAVEENSANSPKASRCGLNSEVRVMVIHLLERIFLLSCMVRVPLPLRIWSMCEYFLFGFFSNKYFIMSVFCELNQW